MWSYIDSALSSLAGYMWYYIQLGAQAILNWLFTAAGWWISNVSVPILSWLWNHVVALLPSSMSGPLQAFATSMQTGALSNIVKVVTFFASFFVPLPLLMTCIGAVFSVWLVSMYLKFIFYVKGHVWSASR